MTKVEKKKESSDDERDSQKSTKSSEKSLNVQISDLQEKLIISERRALGLFELTNDAIFIIDTKGFYIDVNQKAAEILGYNRHDMIGKFMLDFIADDEKKNSQQALSDMLAGKILPIYVRKFKRRDGTIFPAEINAAVVQDEEGNPAYIQSAVRDISERIKVEKTLEREREAFQLVAEATIYSTNITDLCTRIMNGITKILGFDASSVQLYDEETKMLTTTAFINFVGNKAKPQLNPISIDDTNFVFALAARSKRAIIMPRFEDRSIIAPYAEYLRKLGIFSLITWPILAENDKLLGIIQLASYSQKELLEEDLIFFEMFAKMFTLALDKKKAEEAVKLSEEKYRSFAQNFQGIAYRTKIDWTPIFFNGAVKEITGYTSVDLLKWKPRWQEIIHPEDLEVVLELEKQLQTIPGYILDIEYRIISKSGKVKWVNDVSQNICDDNNNPIFVQGAIYDITERKRNENMQTIKRELGISLSLTSNLEEALKVVLKNICGIDVIECGSVYLVNQETGFLNVVSSIGLCQKFVDKISYYSTDSPFTKAILTGKPIFCDYNEIINLENNTFIMIEEIHSLAFIPIYSDDRIISMLCLGSKVLDTIPISTRNTLEIIASQIEGAIARIHAEQALRESDKKYRTFVRNFQGIAYRTDLSGNPIFLDGAVEEITGYTSEEFLTGKISQMDLIHPYDLDDVKKKLKDSIKNPETTGKLESRVITKDGQIRWVQIIWRVILDDNNEPINFQGSMHNITDRMKARDELEKLSQDLEQRVDERTEQLSATNKELTAFSYSVSHDLRTPLRHISGFAQLLEKRVSQMSEVDERILSYTQKIIDSTEEMNKLIDGLLTFSRMSRVEMVKIRINLNELIQEVLNDFQVEMGNRKIDLKFNFIPDVIGDPSLLRLVLVNLIANALKFTKKKELAIIEIGTMPSKDSDKVTIFIRDNGEGFDMKYYDKLFGVFQRLHKNEEFEGTGIGLATVQRVIRRMGGNIWAEGEIKKGATFYFSIEKALDEE
ncbi:MAG: PAS domain S-box protein [Asgard group archaeon]|nr:PAS domain S-box protein [Asgard group archaeon]